MPGELYFDLLAFFEPRVVLAQDLEHFRAREFGRHCTPFGEPLAQLRSGDQQPVGVVVRACPSGRHAAAAIAPERPVECARLDVESSALNLVEDPMGVYRAEIAADAGVVSADDLIRAALVLAKHRV